MKIIGCVLVIMILTSCQKEYSCVCTNPASSNVVFTVKDSKNDAKTKCDKYYQDNFEAIPMNETICAIK